VRRLSEQGHKVVVAAIAIAIFTRTPRPKLKKQGSDDDNDVASSALLPLSCMSSLQSTTTWRFHDYNPELHLCSRRNPQSHRVFVW
jgi:hypothetical protein